jgi:hypothetical protein
MRIYRSDAVDLQSQPLQQLLDGQARLFGPAPDELHDRIASVRLKPSIRSEFPKLLFWRDMLLHQLGESLVLTANPLFQLFDLLPLRSAVRPAFPFQGQSGILE